MAASKRERGLLASALFGPGWLRPRLGLLARVLLVCAAPLAIATGLVVLDDGFRLGSAFTTKILAAALAAVVALLAIELRDLRVAQDRARSALHRAAASEATERSRADELARVLQASEGLALTGEGQVDYLSVMAAITPEGATSFLVRVESETHGAIVAAHGPLAASIVGLRRPLPGDGVGVPPDVQIASFSSSGRVVGVAMPRVHLSGIGDDVVSALTIRLVDHGGRRLGWLHLLDHRGERVLESSFVNLAQLVASQLGVAMENNALLLKVRHQLVEVQRVQQQLVQASKLGAIGELAAAVAHEVNNPLTGILGFSELLMAELPEDDPRHE
jgi:C4-dicarboxylate-specific signal transduction histidine kinase